MTRRDKSLSRNHGSPSPVIREAARIAAPVFYDQGWYPAGVDDPEYGGDLIDRLADTLFKLLDNFPEDEEFTRVSTMRFNIDRSIYPDEEGGGEYAISLELGTIPLYEVEDHD